MRPSPWTGVAPARDNQQWKHACREADIPKEEMEQASNDFHAEKRASGERGHWPYRKLSNWLQEWKKDK